MPGRIRAIAINRPAIKRSRKSGKDDTDDISRSFFGISLIDREAITPKATKSISVAFTSFASDSLKISGIVPAISPMKRKLR